MYLTVLRAIVVLGYVAKKRGSFNQSAETTRVHRRNVEMCVIVRRVQQNNPVM